MAEKRIYPGGIACFNKHEKAPDFIAGDIVIDLAKFKAWVNGEGAQYLTDYKGSPQLKLQFLTGKDGGRPSMQVNTYKPEPKAESAPEPEQNEKDDLPY